MHNHRNEGTLNRRVWCTTCDDRRSACTITGTEVPVLPSDNYRLSLYGIDVQIGQRVLMTDFKIGYRSLLNQNPRLLSRRITI